MFWQTEREEQVLADFRADNHKIACLRKEMAELAEIIASTDDPNLFSWATWMSKSVKHELDQLQA